MLLPSTRLFFLISCCFAVKILLAIYLPLVNDEAYAIAVAKDFSLSFFDHPPIGFWSSQLFMETLDPQRYISFRLPFVFYGLGTTFVLFLIGSELGDHLLGLWCALIYNVAPFFLLSGGFLAMPDGPLNLGIVTAALCILKLHRSRSQHDNFFLVLLGICLAWSFASKYQGFLFGFGCLLVFLASPKRATFLRNPYFYLCMSIAVVGLIPTVLWNSQNQWVSFQFHGARQGSTIHFTNFIQMFLGTMVYLLPPLVLIPITKLIFYFSKAKETALSDTREKLLVVMALPNIVAFSAIFISSDKTFPHWIIPGWLLLVPTVASVLSLPKRRSSRLFFGGSILIIWPLLGLLIIHTQTGLLTNRFKEIPAWDNTLEVLDWRSIRKPLQTLIDTHAPNSQSKLATLTWMEAGQLSVIMENKYETLVIDGDPHHFSFLKQSSVKAPTFLVKVSRGLNPDPTPTLNRIKKYDKTAVHLKNILLLRGSRAYATASVYLLTQ